MKGDEKRTPGEAVDEAIENENFYRLEIKIVYIKPKTRSPKPGKPSKETR